MNDVTKATVKIDSLTNTESPSSEHQMLDTYDSIELAKALAIDQERAVRAVVDAAPLIASAIDAALPRMINGGRLVYVGAGTSGRLGLLDSVELAPTFSWPDERVVPLLAGGSNAIFNAIEGAEDDANQGMLDIRATTLTSNDVVLLIAASGSTPYVIGALNEAKNSGALTIAFANNPGSAIVAMAQIGITLDTGPEIISGSTRLKAGTSQKVALNTFSSGLMVKLGKVYGNLMVDVRPTNNKLKQRCINLSMLATGCSKDTAIKVLDACNNSVKTAIVMINSNLDVNQAEAVLVKFNGNVRNALSQR
jgi:N-acetylmuramic acid 6-phosphate etherase